MFSQNGDTLRCSELHSLTPKFLCVLSALAFARPADFPMGRRRPQGYPPNEVSREASSMRGAVTRLCASAFKIIPHSNSNSELQLLPPKNKPPDFEEVFEVDERHAGPDAVGAEGAKVLAVDHQIRTPAGS